MNSKLKYLPINWRNGMAFSENHLNHQYLAILDSIRDASALHLTNFNYGLLGGEGLKTFSDSFRDNSNNEKVEVPFCRAITKNGSRIDILNQPWEELSKPISVLVGSKNLEDSPFWFILLIIDPFDQKPEGEEDPKENTRRKPFTRPNYRLELMSWDELKVDSLESAIPILKYENTPAGLKKVENYIPPCTRINSHEGLLSKYGEYNRYMTQLKEYSEKIISKIKTKRRNKEQNHLADDIDTICKKYLELFMANYDEYVFTFKELPPIKLAEFFAKFARVLDHSIETAINKDHLLQYFRQYATSMTVAQLSQVIRRTFESNYRHIDISLSLGIIDTFFETLHHIFRELVELDYQELAPRNMITEDRISHTQGERDRRISRGRIKIKHTGKEEYLGDDLED